MTSAVNSSAQSSAPDLKEFVRVFGADQVPVNGNRCVVVQDRGIVIYRRYVGSLATCARSLTRPFAAAAKGQSWIAFVQEFSILCLGRHLLSYGWTAERCKLLRAAPFPADTACLVCSQATIDDIEGQDVATCPWHRFADA